MIFEKMVYVDDLFYLNCGFMKGAQFSLRPFSSRSKSRGTLGTETSGHNSMLLPMFVPKAYITPF